MIAINLKGKCAVVCGSTQGIGKATAHELADLGASVILLARNEPALATVAKQLNTSHGQEHHYVVADFANADYVRGQAQKIIKDHNHVHILINNTGGPAAGPAIDATPAAFLEAFQAHLICNQHLVQAFVPGMQAAGYGRIINVISTSVKAPIPNLGVSNTIRGAVANWSKTLANELGPSGITVNNVLPGLTETARLESLIQGNANKQGIPPQQVAENMKKSVPARRFATAQEVAYAIAFLASPAAAYINGTNLPVDGGRLASL